jgi:hypothetical protein
MQPQQQGDASQDEWDKLRLDYALQPKKVRQASERDALNELQRSETELLHEDRAKLMGSLQSFQHGKTELLEQQQQRESIWAHTMQEKEDAQLRKQNQMEVDFLETSDASASTWLPGLHSYHQGKLKSLKEGQMENSINLKEVQKVAQEKMEKESALETTLLVSTLESKEASMVASQQKATQVLASKHAKDLEKDTEDALVALAMEDTMVRQQKTIIPMPP